MIGITMQPIKKQFIALRNYVRIVAQEELEFITFYRANRNIGYPLRRITYAIKYIKITYPIGEDNGT